MLHTYKSHAMIFIADILPENLHEDNNLNWEVQKTYSGTSQLLAIKTDKNKIMG